jgi:hypothetical protein
LTHETYFLKISFNLETILIIAEAIMENEIPQARLSLETLIVQVANVFKLTHYLNFNMKENFP